MIVRRQAVYLPRTSNEKENIHSIVKANVDLYNQLETVAIFDRESFINSTDQYRFNIAFLFHIFLNRKSLTTASSSESETMSSEPTGATARRRSSTLIIPEGKPTFSQALESELLINEDDQLT